MGWNVSRSVTVFVVAALGIAMVLGVSGVAGAQEVSQENVTATVTEDGEVESVTIEVIVDEETCQGLTDQASDGEGPANYLASELVDRIDGFDDAEAEGADCDGDTALAMTITSVDVSEYEEMQVGIHDGELYWAASGMSHVSDSSVDTYTVEMPDDVTASSNNETGEETVTFDDVEDDSEVYAITETDESDTGGGGGPPAGIPIGSGDDTEDEEADDANESEDGDESDGGDGSDADDESDDSNDGDDDDGEVVDSSESSEGSDMIPGFGIAVGALAVVVSAIALSRRP